MNLKDYSYGLFIFNKSEDRNRLSFLSMRESVLQCFGEGAGQRNPQHDAQNAHN